MNTAARIAELQNQIVKTDEFIARVQAKKARLEAELAKLRAQAK